MEEVETGDERARFRMKLGGAEIEYEGGAASLEKLVMPTVAKIFMMVETHADLQRPAAPLQIEGDVVKPTAAPPTEAFDHMTHTIAVAMKAESAGDLAMAASARLGLVKKSERFTRKEILEEMKSAPSFYNANMNKNLSAILASLTGPPSPRLRLVEKDVYALANGEKTKLEQLLAQIK